MSETLMVGVMDPNSEIASNMLTNKEGKSEMHGGDCVSVNPYTRPDYFKSCKKKSLTNVESLPDDLFYSILLLLPAQDVYALRLVCRKWYHMIHTRDFINAHLQRTTCGLLIQDFLEHQHPVLLTTRQGRIVMSKFGYSFRDNVLASCNGLILEYEMENKDAIYIANPVTKQQLVIPLFPHGRLHRACYGMGYAAALMKYKLVVSYSSQDGNSKVAILTIGVDNLWRDVNIQLLSDTTKVRLYGAPLITEGFMHWYRNGTHVLTLNLETEIITETAVPQVFGVITEKYYLSAGKHLSLLIPRGEFSWEVWEMKPETGEWTKLPNIDMEAQKRAFKRFGCEYNRTLVPLGWLIYKEVLVFDSINPVRACIVYNVRTQEIDSFKLASFGKLYTFRVHRNSLVWFGG